MFVIICLKIPKFLQFFLLHFDYFLWKSLFAGTPTSYLLATIGQPEKQQKDSANRKRE